MDSRIGKPLNSLPPFAQDDPVLPPVGRPADFLGTMRMTPEAWLLKHAGVEASDVEPLIRRDTFPIPDDVNREGYSAGYHLPFWLSGLGDYLKTTATATRHGCAGGRVYDFGGGTGRVFRHFAAQSEAWEVWSSDFRLSSVKWNLQHYPSRIRVFANTSAPSLPLPDGTFDLVTAFSVFTHIDQMETPWLLELRRILRPGGLACLTIHDEETWRTNDALRTTMLEGLGLPPDAPMPEGKTVSVWREDDPYNCNVFHSGEHVARVWGRYFEILEIQPRAAGAQSVVVCRRAD